MKTSKRMITVLLGLMLLLLLLPAGALAAERADAEQAVSLTVSAVDGETPLAGQRFDLYLVAEPDSSGTLRATEAFEQFDIQIDGTDDEGWKNLASTLEGYVLRDRLAPAASAVTDEAGAAVFRPGRGLYLLSAGLHTQNGLIYETAPSMVLLPAYDGDSGRRLYDVTVRPKLQSTPEEQPETVERKVLKVWKDDGNRDKRPEKITVQLLCDGEVYDTVTLSDENNWRYSWTELEDGHKWNVTEDRTEGYTVRITQEGITFVVTNTCDTPDAPPPPDTPKEPRLPQTGQDWWPVPVLMASGLLLVALGLLRRRGGAEHEK